MGEILLPKHFPDVDVLATKDMAIPAPFAGTECQFSKAMAIGTTSRMREGQGRLEERIELLSLLLVACTMVIVLDRSIMGLVRECQPCHVSFPSNATRCRCTTRSRTHTSARIHPNSLQAVRAFLMETTWDTVHTSGSNPIDFLSNLWSDPIGPGLQEDVPNVVFERHHT